ncbi:DUF4387 domain-containing protein [Bacillaceae bacterium SIJ1]|uniref:DUF4387 domain-containing protein n=1 Tax=Litoribacterium kuwaitense TaxID=1398745 RepID=UPI0013EA0EB9|nr:DUF4387 domain-containing protein [Litoribacterium kuwaitense]NGP45663.1 DUF4387 domain-containing protein [Litoribacterium kuwaitense]
MPKTMKNIKELASVIRSKNAGPYELTLDIIFKDQHIFTQVKESKTITKELIASLYKIPVEQVISLVEFEPANAIKATIVRPRVAGDLGETDVYGAQQHGPLLNLSFEMDAS